VIRDGKEIRIPGVEVVTVDLIILHEGDRIPGREDTGINE